MSNDSPWTSPGWASPGGTPDADQGAATPYGAPPANGASPASDPAAPAYGPTATGGWAPPPRPGLIPLRPIDFGTLFGATFRVLKRNPRPTFGAALLMNAVVQLVAFAAVFGLSFSNIDRLAQAGAEDADAILAGTIGLILIGSVLASIVALVGQAFLQGIITIEVSRQVLGEKNTLRQLFALGKGRWGALIGWTMLLSLAVILAFGVLFGLVFVMVVLGEPLSIALGVVVAITGAIGLLVLSVWLWVKLALVAPALMIERLTLGQAIARAWTLVRGSFWRTLGILLLVTVIVQVAVSIVTAPFSLIGIFGSTLINPAGDDLSSLWILVGTNVLTVAVTVIVGAIGLVLMTSAVALIYTDIRMRREGLDLDLQQAVEQKAAGGTPDDPYRRGLSTTATRPL